MSYRSCTGLRTGPQNGLFSGSAPARLPRGNGMHPLPLLPSGPDGVRGIAPRGTKLSQRRLRGHTRRAPPSCRPFGPAIADFGFRAPLAPRLARPEAVQRALAQEDLTSDERSGPRDRVTRGRASGIRRRRIPSERIRRRVNEPKDYAAKRGALVNARLRLEQSGFEPPTSSVRGRRSPS
jgi:hypothetical protein